MDKTSWTDSRLDVFDIITLKWRPLDGIDEVNGKVSSDRSDVLEVRVVGTLVPRSSLLAGSVGGAAVVLGGMVGMVGLVVVEPRLVGRKLVTLMVGSTVVGTVPIDSKHFNSF